LHPLIIRAYSTVRTVANAVRGAEQVRYRFAALARSAERGAEEVVL